MTAPKKAFEGVARDPRGNEVKVGSEVAYAVRQGDTARLRIGVVEFIEAGKPPYYKKELGSVPIFYCRFEGNERVSRCTTPENIVVLGAVDLT